jgi:hypothetical protein
MVKELMYSEIADWWPLLSNMTSGSDLTAAVETTFVHTRPGGLALVVYGRERSRRSLGQVHAVRMIRARMATSRAAPRPK